MMPPRRDVPLPRLRRSLALLAIAFGLLHALSFTWYALRSTLRPPLPVAPHLPLRADQQRMAHALGELLREDGVAEARRWAEAIVAFAPAADAGTIALVTAQIRRESHFLERDLEWLFRRAVPDLLHDLGVPDPIRTIGPMQIAHGLLRELIRATDGVELEDHELKVEAYTLETGVRYCALYLAGLMRQYLADGPPGGFIDHLGEPPPTTADPIDGPTHLAAVQKMLSDLTGTPLVLDGQPGPRTLALAQQFAMTWDPAGALGPTLEDDLRRIATADPGDPSATALGAALTGAWRSRFGHRPPTSWPITYTHDPRLAFVFSDFNAGRGAARVAALQATLAALDGAPLAADGKPGPRTRSAMQCFVARLADLPARQRADLIDLIATGRKPRFVLARVTSLARRAFQDRFGNAPAALRVPDLHHSGLAQSLKGIGRISVADYVAGSAFFFEQYYLRLVRRLAADTATGP